MEVAWTTILIVALLSPGVFFFIGYATRDRAPHEIVKSGAIGEIAWAILIAIIIHLGSWTILSVCGFKLSNFISPLAEFESTPAWLSAERIVSRVLPLVLYYIVTSLFGLLIGWLVAISVVSGKLKALARHKWLTEVTSSMKKGLVTAFVMTTMKENGRVLLYKGILAEFYLKAEGTFAYVVLKRCAKFYMTFAEDIPMTGAQRQLFASQDERPDQVWDYLLIDGTNIANILFDPSPQIKESGPGGKALQAEYDAIISAIEQAAAAASGTGGGAGITAGTSRGGGTS